MRRRSFLSLLAATVTSARPARAQTQHMRRVAIVSGFSQTEMVPLLARFRQTLEQLGWTEGRNLVIDMHLASGNTADLVKAAAAAISTKPDLIVAQGTPGLLAVRQVSKTIPVVFNFVADPVATGLVESLSRPGGQSTGFTNFEFTIAGKWLDLLMAIAPGAKRLLWLANPANTAGPRYLEVLEAAKSRWQIAIDASPVRDREEIEDALKRFAAGPSGCLLVQPDALMTVSRDLIIALAARHKLPALYPFHIFAANGGLMSYGLNPVEAYRETADYVDRILRGAKPADLPVQAPRKFDLVINLKTAKALGLEMPATLLAIADEVIE